MIDLLGWLSFVLFAIMQIPQIWKTIKTKDVSGVSVLTWVIYAIALSLSAIYLILFNKENKPWPVITNQILSAVMSLIQVVLYYRFKSK